MRQAGGWQNRGDAAADTGLETRAAVARAMAIRNNTILFIEDSFRRGHRMLA
jgi:hypothetical protein